MQRLRDLTSKRSRQSANPTPESESSSHSKKPRRQESIECLSEHGSNSTDQEVDCEIEDPKRYVPIPTEQDIVEYLERNQFCFARLDHIDYHPNFFSNHMEIFARDVMFRKSLNWLYGYQILSVLGDAASFYRAVAVSLYGQEDYYETVRHQVLDYLLANAECFSSAIEGGVKSFVTKKRSHVDSAEAIEVQAAADLYCRPVIVYIYNGEHASDPDEPIVHSIIKKHISDSNRKSVAIIEKGKIIAERGRPIRVSYHLDLFYNAVIAAQPGDFEEVPCKEEESESSDDELPPPFA